MGFDYNPFNHVELVRAPDRSGWTWHCHNCGADSHRGSNSREPLVSIDLLSLLMGWVDHLIHSHGVSPADFADWSDY